MPKVPPKKCKACGDSGVASSGKPCVPCERAGRTIKVESLIPQGKAAVKITAKRSVFDL